MPASMSCLATSAAAAGGTAMMAMRMPCRRTNGANRPWDQPVARRSCGLAGDIGIEAGKDGEAILFKTLVGHQGSPQVAHATSTTAAAFAAEHAGNVVVQSLHVVPEAAFAELAKKGEVLAQEGWFNTGHFAKFPAGNDLAPAFAACSKQRRYTLKRYTVFFGVVSFIMLTRRHHSGQGDVKTLLRFTGHRNATPGGRSGRGHRAGFAKASKRARTVGSFGLRRLGVLQLLPGGGALSQVPQQQGEFHPFVHVVRVQCHRALQVLQSPFGPGSAA